ncbi:MAG TPA: NgoFVII family restriction endonuclease [Candidatus Omnitrophota bacterium]|nr:NgoFVII family restriction endonuclease [Candidatus Omnitrophota bacterium]
MFFDPFYPKQSSPQRKKYKQLILGTAQLSPIFSGNTKPYLPYRVVEKIFCKAFEASDETRKDVSVDAVKITDGIGVKTFLAKPAMRGTEKVAEFNNRAKFPLDLTNDDHLIKQVALYRNQRIEETVKAYGLKNTVYHYVVRDVGKIYIAECPMIPIDLPSIRGIEKKRGSVAFEDKYFKYTFNISKSVLLMDFSYAQYFDAVEINGFLNKALLNAALDELSEPDTVDRSLIKKTDYVILPLYSTRTGKVSLKSGLNQWNAGGRSRHPDEVYIPIPQIIHQVKPGFFPPKDQKFKLITDDGREMTAKVCQQGCKALMSDPNKELGNWILRKKLQLVPGQVATLSHLQEFNSDNVIIYKIEESVYKINTHSLGSFKSEYDS